MTKPTLRPRLVVADGVKAIDFYRAALDAEELVRYAEPSGAIVHAELKIGDDVFSLTQEEGVHNISPDTLGGSPMLLTLEVDDADQAGAAMEAAGATVVIPIDDRYYGNREGRLRDPFGHLWIISQRNDDLSTDEIQRRIDAETD